MSVSFRRITVALILVLAWCAVGHAQTRRRIVHVFTGGPADGAMPEAGLVFGADGNLYGTTTKGGEFDKGTVFRMTPSGAITLLHSFAGGQDDGATPASALTPAGDGNFYGTTLEGGSPTEPGFGTVFRIAPDGAYAVLHSFDGIDGASPFKLISSSDGDLYGTTSGGGALGLGMAFRMTRAGVLTILHDFGPIPDYAYNLTPTGPLVEGPDGAFYGTSTTAFYGSDTLEQYFGLLYKMTRDGTVTKLHAFEFGPADGSKPNGGLLLANDGNLYGTTATGGMWEPIGIFYRQTLTGQFSYLAEFSQNRADRRRSDLIQAADGYLYGTDFAARSDLAPTVFRFTLTGAFTRLYAFPRESNVPFPSPPLRMPAPVLQAPDGSFYGVAKYHNGDSGPALGCVYRLIESPTNGFDDDRTSDMPLYDAATGTWRILTSSSGYVASMRIFWGGPDYMPVPADYDGDGRLDVAVYHAGRGLWYILTSSSDFTTILIKAWGGVGYTPVPGDYDHDQKADFALYHRTTGRWYILFSSGASLAISRGSHAFVPVRGDFDGDDVADLALYAPATGAWQIWQSGSAFATSRSATLGGPGAAPVPGDYDGDRTTDIAVYNEASGLWSVVTSTGGFTTTWTLGWGGPGYMAVPGDFDGDRRNDLAVRRADTGEWFVLQSSTGFASTLYAQWGNPTDVVVSMQPLRVAWTDALRSTDYDGDGRSDIAVYEPSTGTWSIRESSTNFTNTRTIAWGGAGDTPVPGDYDGDGRTDAATFNEATGSWSAQLTSGSVLNVILGSPGDVPLARDYDGDLITDIAVFTPATGVWRFLLSTSGFTTLSTVTWGDQTGWTPVPGDYDGDGKADLGQYQPTTGYWRVLLAANHYSTVLAFDWGGPGYTAVPGDYDGDGQYDFAVCFNATGQWYVVKSGVGYTIVLAVPWGEPIDTPRSADYDGDGIADMASYDSTTGEWDLLLSSSYFTLRVERTLGGAGFVLPRTP